MERAEQPHGVLAGITAGFVWKWGVLETANVDAEALQTMVDLAMELRPPTLREVEVVSLDMDIAERFRLSLNEELEPSAPAP